MKGKMIFTAGEHERAECEVFSSLEIPGAARLTVGGESADGFMGFGTAITPSSCYVLSRMEPGKREALLKELYSEEGTGLSIARLSIASCDYSAELYSYDDHAYDTELEHFSIERDEEYVIPMIREILKVKPDLYLFASPWSPPYWMKTGGSMCGGYMRNEYVDCYAEYIVKFIKAYEAHGIRISAITPQNEMETQQDGKMPSCIWHPDTEAKFISALRKKLRREGLDVKIWMYDHNFLGTARVLWSLENYEGLCEDCDGVAFHYYAGDIRQTMEVKRKFPGLDLHFTEGGPRLTDHYETDFCKWGLMAVKALKAGYKSFTGWNLTLDELGGPNIGPFIGICGGFVTVDSRSGETRRSGQYRAYSHIAPYIRSDSRIYPLSDTGAFTWHMSSYPGYDLEIEGVLIDNGDGKKIAVLVNPAARGRQVQIEIDGTLWYAELRAESIATIIV